MTTQSCIAGQSVGTGSNKGPNLFSITPKTLASTTTAYIVNVKLTTGSAVVPANAPLITVQFTSTMRTVTAANAAEQLAQSASKVEITPAEVVSGIAIKDSRVVVKTGDNFHLWVSVPPLPAAATLDVDLVEIPS